MYPLKQSTAINLVIFAFDSSGDPVTGLANGDWTKRISKNGGAFAAMTVTITELEGGFYSVPLTAAHTDTLGILTLYFTAAGIKQVNVQFRVEGQLIEDISTATFPTGAIEFTYTVTNANNGNPIGNVDVWITTDLAGTNVIWRGMTDTSGIALDVNNNKPLLDAATYYFWRQKTGFSFTNPDTEVVS